MLSFLIRIISWTYRKKWMATVIVSFFTFISPVSSSMVAPATSQIVDEFGITNSVIQAMVTSVFILGYGKSGLPIKINYWSCPKPSVHWSVNLLISFVPFLSLFSFLVQWVNCGDDRGSYSWPISFTWVSLINQIFIRVLTLFGSLEHWMRLCPKQRAINSLSFLSWYRRKCSFSGKLFSVTHVTNSQ